MARSPPRLVDTVRWRRAALADVPRDFLRGVSRGVPRDFAAAFPRALAPLVASDGASSRDVDRADDVAVDVAAFAGVVFLRLALMTCAEVGSWDIPRVSASRYDAVTARAVRRQCWPPDATFTRYALEPRPFSPTAGEGEA
ncbi:MAG: hypothetical protein IPJ56_20365 [Gemmatimonadetes bacterium]|nr:hypothetical protein [Gemmatimonadota bacterium]